MEEFEDKNTLSIDEFFKQLEAKEQDLDITSEVVIEIDESGDDENHSFFNDSEFSVGDEESFLNEIFPLNIPEQNEKFSEFNKEISDLRDRLSKTEAERAELIELSRRRKNDFDNYKKRIEREKQETFNAQLGELIVRLLPVLDNLNRALDAASEISGERDQEFQQFYDGIELVNQQMNEVLANLGIQPINAVGETFDPNFHEAVAAEEKADVPPNIVTAELVRGYRLGDKIIRPSMVEVSASVK